MGDLPDPALLAHDDLEAMVQGPLQQRRPEFYLVPLNGSAKLVVADPYNEPYLAPPQENVEPSLNLSFLLQGRNKIILGRGENVDILLPDPKRHGDISKRQAAFEYHESTGAVFLTDYSSAKSTETISARHTGGDTIIDMPSSSPRTVLVARCINTHIAFGRDQYYKFDLVWHCDGLLDFPTEGSLICGPKHGKKKYVQSDWIGGGAFGDVYRALDVYTGKTFAVKQFRQLDGGRNLEMAFREIRNLYKINKSTLDRHVRGCVILSPFLPVSLLMKLDMDRNTFLTSLGIAGFGKNDSWGEIFMPLKDGSVKSLVNEVTPDQLPILAMTVLKQMLRALKSMVKHNIIHRDIKPENILYDTGPNGWHFQLGDFGLSNDPNSAKTMAGTYAFMAPEVWYREKKLKQTAKVDIWSLFVTIIWIYNVDNFRTNTRDELPYEVHSRVEELAMLPLFERYRDMANVDPKDRPSAREVLKRIGEDVEEEDLVQGMAQMNVGTIPGDYGDQHAGEEELQEDEYAIAAKQLYETGESSRQGQSAIPRHGEAGRSGQQPYESLSGRVLTSFDVFGSPEGGGGYSGPGTEVPDQATVRDTVPETVIKKVKKKHGKH